MADEPPRFSALVLGTVLVLSALFSLSIIPSNSSAHSMDHGAIMITGNSDFTAANGVTGGSGTESDPFIIEGWDIVFETGTGIIVSSTTSHLVIRNVHVVGLSWHATGGIVLTNSENITIEGATVDIAARTWGMDALLVDGCKNILVTNCSLDPRSDQPIDVRNSQNVTFEYCFIGPQGFGGIALTSTSGFVIKGNTFYGRGLRLDDSDNGLVIENDFWWCYEPVYFTNSHDVNCYHNSYFSYEDSAIWTVEMCYSMSFTNGYPSGGNFYEWNNATDHKSGPGQDLPGSDGIADDPYQVDQLTDPYPLMSRYVALKHLGDYIEVYPWWTLVFVQEPMDVIAIPVDMYGLDRVAALSWSCDRSDCTIEEVSADPARIHFTADAGGLFEVSVTDGNFTTSLAIKADLGLSAIEISPASTSVAFGDTIQFSAIGYNLYGPVQVDPVWSVGDPNDINQTGFFAAIYYPASNIRSATDIDSYTETVYASQEIVTGSTTVQIILDGVSDQDSDAMPDWWELKYGLGSFDPSDAPEDPDADGLPNLNEYLNGTSPNAAKSDSDLMVDGWEVAHGLDPLNGSDGILDADSDGLINNYEYVCASDPNDPDTDSDGMTDGFEYNNTLNVTDPSDAVLDRDLDGLTNFEEFVLGTNPRSGDTDSDAMPDLWEISNDLDPRNYSDKYLDKDGDLLMNYVEFAWGTDPSNPDTDGDGLPDGIEQIPWLSPLDPSDASYDNDSDGLSNLEEYNLGTSIWLNDTDSDSMPDGWEVAKGFDPTNSTDASQDPDNDLAYNWYEYEKGTDPHDNDTDSDTVLDGVEAIYGMDPLDPEDAWLDWDGDSIVNANEILRGTDLGDSDTDDDQLGDGFEILFTMTDPTAWDSDGDGLGDSVEFLLSHGYTGELVAIPDGWLGISITCGNYTIQARTNSSVMEGGYDKETKKLTLRVGGPDGTFGALDLIVPKSLCAESDISLMLDDAQLNFTLTQNETHYIIHAEYAHSSHMVVAQFLASANPEEPSDDDDGLGAYAIYIGGAVAAILIVAAAIVLIMRKRKPA